MRFEFVTFCSCIQNIISRETQLWVDLDLITQLYKQCKKIIIKPNIEFTQYIADHLILFFEKNCNKNIKKELDKFRNTLIKSFEESLNIKVDTIN